MYDLEFVKSVFQQASDAMMVLDENRVIRFANDEAARMLDYTPQKLLDRPLDDLLVEPQAFLRQLSENRLVSTPVTLRDRNGLSVRRCLTLTPARDASHAITGYLLTWRVDVPDCTDRRRQWSQILQAAGTLAGEMAHTFRNHITVVKGMAEMLVRRKLVNDSGAEALRDILEVCGQSIDFTDGLFAISREELYHYQPLELVLWLGGLKSTLREILPTTINLDIQAQVDQCIVETDPQLLERVLCGMALSARDEMSSQGRLTITLNIADRCDGEGAAPGRYARLAISDTAPARDRQGLDNAFQPIRRPRNLSDRTGLERLAALAFARQCRGTMDATSHPDGGNTFTFYLPCL